MRITEVYTHEDEITKANITHSITYVPQLINCDENVDQFDDPFIDPFWDDVAFVIRTGDNVKDDRFPAGYFSWHKRVKHIEYVSDAPQENYSYHWRGRNVTIDKLWDGVYPYAKEGDISISNLPWERDFVKHLAGFQILYEQHPKKKYYVMADDDTYFFLEQLKNLLVTNEWNPMEQHVLLADCNGIDFSLPLHSCNGKFPQGSYFTAGGGGIIISHKSMESMYAILPHCYEDYKDCWAGDRRLGACLFDAGVPFCNSSLFATRDITADFRPDHWQLTTLHKMNSKQMLLVDFLAENSPQPGLLTDDIFHTYWDFINKEKDW